MANCSPHHGLLLLLVKPRFKGSRFYKALEERVPQNEERGRNEIPFQQKRTEQECVPQNCKGTKKERFLPFSFNFYQICSYSILVINRDKYKQKI